MGPPYSDRVSRAPPYFSQAQYHNRVFAYGAVTRYGATFQRLPLTQSLSLAGCSHFARHYFGNHIRFLFLALLRCFSSCRSPPYPIYSDKVSRAPPYLSLTQYHSAVFTYGAITHYGATFQRLPLTNRLSLAGCSHFARHYFGNLG